MAKYDVYRTPNGPGYVLDVQSDLLDQLNTRIVIPLLPLDQSPTPARRLNPIFILDQKQCVLVTQFLSAIPLTSLGKPVGNLADHFADITAAMDMLTHGF